METSWRRLYEEGRRTLESAGVSEASTDAWLLVSHVFGIDRTAYFMDRDIPRCPDESALQTYRGLLKRRSERIPLQYLIGKQEFCGLEFEVNPDVLIPRADTERLVEAVLEYCKGAPGGRLLDLCTGSGCIAIALSVLGNFRETEGLDISEKALMTARRNAVINHAGVSFRCGDLFAKASGRYDIIVSNPPYISDDVIRTLEPEVKDHEPVGALSGGADGLAFYRRIAAEAGGFLTDGGMLFLEIGYDQGAAVTGLLSAAGFREIRILQDYAGSDRVVRAAYRFRKED